MSCQLQGEPWTPWKNRNCCVQMTLTTLSMTKSHGQICLPEFCPLLTHILHIDTENNHKLHDKRNWSVQLTLKTPSMTKNHGQLCLPEFRPLLTYIQHVDSENNHKLHKRTETVVNNWPSKYSAQPKATIKSVCQNSIHYSPTSSTLTVQEYPGAPWDTTV